MPFAVDRRDGVLTLTLDTPGSPINIFNHATAHQLIEILSEVTPATTRAIVFDSAKANSFINGVGLLLAQAARNREDVMRASTPPWTAYRMVRDAPVPTIAVIEGNCFGCGVEFVLGCDYRLAADTWETQFYMTELNDYLFMPLFGSTWNLPEAVGVEAAIDLLLWGERWHGAEALERGLVDDVAPYEELPARRADFLARVLADELPSRRHGRVRWGEREDRVVEQTRRRIAALPAAYQALYSAGLSLIESGARQTHGYLEHQKLELAESGASALAPMGKSAYAFFYLRQMAGERAAGRPRGGTPAASFRLAVPEGDSARPFVDDLRGRRLRQVSFEADGDADFCLLGSSAAEAPAATPPGLNVVVRNQLAVGPRAAAEVYVPGDRFGCRLVELAADDTCDGEAVQRLARAFQRLGFEVARTAPDGVFVSTRLLVAYLAPLLRFVEGSGDASGVNATLRHEGFRRLPGELLVVAEPRRAAEIVASLLARPLAAVEAGIAGLVAAPVEGVRQPALVDALCLSLLEAVLTARQRREIRDTSISDLIARELLDFPRHLCSLATWLRTSTVARALDHAAARDLVSEATVETAAGFVAAGRELYR